MNTTLYQHLYEDLKEYLKLKIGKVYVYRTPPQTVAFPKYVIFSEVANQVEGRTVDGLQGNDLLGYEFRVVCSFKDSEKNVDEARKIASEIDKFMELVGFDRVSFNTIPNVDGSIYNIITRYTAKVSINRGTIIS